MYKLSRCLIFFALVGTLVLQVGCTSRTSFEDARTAYFATVDGSDDDCRGWLEWCVEEGYPRSDCEERNEYCVDGEWLGGDDDDSSDPCAPAMDEAYRECVDAGGTDEECREAAEAAYADCVGQ